MRLLKTLFVGGDWNADGGRSSGFFGKLAAACEREADGVFGAFTVLNGGEWSKLEAMLPSLGQYGVIVWAANIPNDLPKKVKSVKEYAPHAMLTITKNNRAGKYTRIMLVARALQSKANLLLEFTEPEPGVLATTILDPLDNIWLQSSTNIDHAAMAWVSRVHELMQFTRAASRSIQSEPVVPSRSDELEMFLGLVRGYADQFHTLIHAAHQERLLGNVSFRCETGFPSMRNDDWFFVSRRNSDKRDLVYDGFCACKLDGGNGVEYCGEHKPSVDTPIQKQLYQAWPQARFMLHSHCFIEGAIMTDRFVPCGALEEVGEILNVAPGYDPAQPLFINLRGHGSLAVAATAEQLRDIKYVAKH